MSSLRDLPSVDALLQTPLAAALEADFGRRLTLDALRAALADVRTGWTPGQSAPDSPTLLDAARRKLFAWTAPTLLPVINATGVILHTNLGRAPLSRAALQAMAAAGEGYSNLEFDLHSGKRGSRYDHTADLICRLTGAEAALVVNNNAAAVLLVLSALASRRRAVISRTQLVEIGGGFRIPDVMKQSGVRLVEIGTTNRVHLEDYELALQQQPVRLVLMAHSSNFRIVGFTAEPAREEIAALCRRAGVPFVEDLGSGALLDTAAFGLGHEPTPQESLAAGVDLVTFSGDKLLGGPQAGIIAGRAELVARIKKHPLARAVRADKTTYAGLSATLLHYLKEEALKEIPIWRMIAAPEADLERRARAWETAFHAAGLSAGTVPGRSTVGGGSLPGETLPTTLAAVRPRSVQRGLAALRAASIPVIARAQDDHILFDPRTVLPEQDERLQELAVQVLHG